MRYGLAPEPGFLPVFSVDTEEDAERLLMFSCPINLDGDYVAPELAHDQTLENLDAFSDRLASHWETLQANKRRRDGHGNVHNGPGE